MAPKTLPPSALLREMLDYNDATGDFTWLERPLSHFPNEPIQRMWNAQNAGRPAGHVNPAGYLVISKKYWRAHRLAWLLIRGEPVPDVIDHIDGDRLNNRIANLRAATNADNQANSVRSRDNKSGVKGVYKRNTYFEVWIARHGKNHYLGSFPTLEEAAKARYDAAIRLHGAFAKH